MEKLNRRLSTVQIGFHHTSLHGYEKKSETMGHEVGSFDHSHGIHEFVNHPNGKLDPQY